MAIAFLNGQFIDPADARVSALDAGIQHGVGLFETLLGGCGSTPSSAAASAGGSATHPHTGAWAMMLEEHLNRLAQSARELGLSAGLNVDALHEATMDTIVRAALPRARVRITITGGDLNLLRAARSTAEGAVADGGSASPPAPARPQGTVLISAVPATEYPPAMIEAGVGVMISDAKANPFNPCEAHKTLNYWWRLRELGLAAQRSGDEALIFSVTNHLVGGCVSSAMLIKDDECIVPICRGEETQVASQGASTSASTEPSRAIVLPSAALPGITRAWAINELAGEGMLTHKRMVTIADVLEADEVMLLNSSWGVLPVVRIEGRSIAGGAPGETSRLLVNRWNRTLAALAGN
ncbi:MAG: aminotransferase class IV [Phycisphaerales bacterium]|nr:aminotransferase class IV [Phycisphaerales bacterium]